MLLTSCWFMIVWWLFSEHVSGHRNNLWSDTFKLEKKKLLGFQSHPFQRLQWLFPRHNFTCVQSVSPFFCTKLHKLWRVLVLFWILLLPVFRMSKAI